jgi:hypothetical protein
MRHLLIDSTHKRWFCTTLVLAVAALAGYLVLDYLRGGLTGGSTVGLWYGVVGSGLMVYAGLLSALRRVPTWTWLGARKVWLRGHIWLGLLSGVFLLCHSGFRFGGPLEQILWGCVLGVLATGVFGLFVQQLLPQLLTTRVPCEAPYEQIPHLCQVMRRKADALVDDVCGAYDPHTQTIETTRAAARLAEDAKAQLRAFYECDVRPFLAERCPPSSPLVNPLQAEARFAKLRNLSGLTEMRDQLGQLAALCEERRLLAEQERIHFWLHSWLLLHIPLSVAVLVLGVAHVVTALYY